MREFPKSAPAQGRTKFRISHFAFRILQNAFLIANCSLLIFFVSCHKITPVEAANRQKILLIGNQSEPQDLDPQIISAFTDSNLCEALYEGLVMCDWQTIQPVPGVAERWEISPDGKVYTFHFRENARWSNGDPVTAFDFAFSYQRMLSPNLASEYAYMLYCIKNAEPFNQGKLKDFAQVGVKALDVRTLEITLENPVSYFLSLTAMPYYFPVHPPTILKFGAMDERATPWTRPGHIVTNGPFRLKRWQVNSVIEMEKNPTYWNAAANPINGLRFYPIDNASQEERLIRSGQLHVSYEMPIDKIGAYQAAGSPFLRIDPFLETFFLRFNVTNPVMKEKRIRQALARAIDRAQLVREVTRGGQQPATHFVPPDTAGYTCAFQAKTDFDSARKLLAEAGYPGGKGFPAVDLIFNSSDFNRRVLEAIQEMWKRELGISVTISNQEFKVYLDAQRTLNYTLCRARWVGDYADPSTFLEMFITGGGNNQTGWSNTTYDRLIQESQRASTREARYAIYQQAEALLLEECPISPVFFGTRVFLLNPAVKNWKPSLLGFQRYQDIRLEP